MLKNGILLVAAVVALAGLWAAYTWAHYMVFWSPAEPVVFDSDGVQLSGLLVRPGSKRDSPAFVMLQGAGPDEGLGAGYRAHAKALTRRGFSVLLYNKRGTGESGGDFASATYADFIADAEAALRFLARQPGIDPERIGLFGASESGWFTPGIADRNPEVAFVINKVGPPLSWIDTVAWELRNDLAAEDVAEDDIEALVPLQRRAWAHLAAAAATPSLASGRERADLEAEIAALRAARPHLDALLPELPPYDPVVYEAFRDYALDPTPHLKSLDLPMLYVFGEDDINVPSAASAAALEALREADGKPWTVHVLPGVGHALYTWRGILGAGYPPGYLDFVGDWAVEQAGLD